MDEIHYELPEIMAELDRRYRGDINTADHELALKAARSELLSAKAYQLRDIKAELVRRGVLPLVQDEADDVDDAELRAVKAELARRAESDPMVVFASALNALTQAIATLAERSPGGPVTKVVERDAAGNIVRIIESPQ